MWESLEECSPDKRAPLMGQWRALSKELAELAEASGKGGDPIDEIAARRVARGGATSRLGQTGGRAR